MHTLPRNLPFIYRFCVVGSNTTSGTSADLDSSFFKLISKIFDKTTINPSTTRNNPSVSKPAKLTCTLLYTTVVIGSQCDANSVVIGRSTFGKHDHVGPWSTSVLGHFGLQKGLK